MKTKNFNFFLTIVLLLTCTVGFSQEYVTTGKCRLTINVIDKNNRRVEVTGLKNREYSGDVVIPSCINVNGVKYTVTRIGDSAFDCCENLKSVTIPSSVTRIGDSAFDGCVSLTSIKIPNSVKSIGKNAFGVYEFNGGMESCKNLRSIKVDPNNPIYDSRNNCNAIIETRSNTLLQGCQSTVIPKTIKRIGDYAFWECENLTSITIPYSVTSIGNWAFGDCKNLKTIILPRYIKNVNEIGLPEGVKIIWK